MKSEGNESKLEGETFEPGSARFGNFINYYSFNSVSKRLDAIPSNFFPEISTEGKVVCLDIGCNAGDLTFGLYDQLISTSEKNVDILILGIDLDETLITRCQEKNKNHEHIVFKQLDIMTDTALKELVQFLEIHGKTKFDLVTCFSTTMWIHLNHGDTGLEYFLRTISELASCFLVEPQEWKSYKSAARRMTRLNQEAFVLKNLKIRDIIGYLEAFLCSECNMNRIDCQDTSWGRKLFLFKSKLLR